MQAYGKQEWACGKQVLVCDKLVQVYGKLVQVYDKLEVQVCKQGYKTKYSYRHSNMSSWTMNVTYAGL